jgi:uncharacterized membrane protein YccF (DUF307 family)
MGNQPQVTQVVVNAPQTGCLVQIIWFLFIGWWWGALWIGLAWGAMVTVLGIPLGIWMINRIGQMMALRGTRNATTITMAGGVTMVSQGKPQHNFIIRALWFALVGWWASAFWMSIAYLCAITVFLMPLGFWMFDRTPGILTLQQ